MNEQEIFIKRAHKKVTVLLQLNVNFEMHFYAFFKKKVKWSINMIDRYK